MNGGTTTDMLRQMRALGGQVERIREETRRFWEARDRELGDVLDRVNHICSGLVETEATPIGSFNNTSGRSNPGSAKKDNVSLGSGSVKRENVSEPEVKFSDTKKFKMDDNMGSKFTVSDGYVQVYTDGACPDNGKPTARAGVGVWWGDGHPLNLSQPVAGNRHTNNTAEIQAASLSISQASGAGVDKLMVNTDSQFLINCVTKWMANWKRNGWKTGSGQEVKNKEDLLEVDKLLLGGKVDVKWTHVKGHSDNRGNNEADRLAVKGAKMC